MSFEIPISTMIVSLTSICVALISNLLTRRFVDLHSERRIKAEIDQYTKELKAAVLAKDKDKEGRLKKKEKQIQAMRLKMSSGRMKITGLTFIPFIAVYYLMAGFLGGFSVTVAYSPIPIPIIIPSLSAAGSGSVSLFWWYFISSLTFSGLMTRLLGTST
jgi:uncharacterized membrane protein (DUF106 family)